MKPLRSVGTIMATVSPSRRRDGVDIGAGRRAVGIVQRHRRADIGRLQHVLALGNDAEQRRREDFEDVVDREHLAARRARRIVARDQDVLLDPLALLRLHGLGIEHADDAVGIAHRGDLGIGDDDGLVGIAHRQRGAALDAGRAVADDPVEPGRAARR